MQIEFGDGELEKLATDAAYAGKWAPEIIKAYRRQVQAIVAAKDERDLRYRGGNHFERLKGDRSHQHSMRLNDQWRLILEITTGERGKTVRLVEITDYH